MSNLRNWEPRCWCGMPSATSHTHSGAGGNGTGYVWPSTSYTTTLTGHVPEFSDGYVGQHRA